ncbi:hypothetical protein ACWCOV_37990 [Kribbella sp. NPDC002412]
MTAELLPSRVRFAPDEPVVVEARISGPTTATVWHLGERVREVTGTGQLDLGTLPLGGYGVEVVTADGVLRTAVEVGARAACGTGSSRPAPPAVTSPRWPTTYGGCT